MGYVWGSRSKQRLKGIHPNLRAVTDKALEVSTVDFSVLEGLRSYERQRELVDRGVSWTMNSRHLTGHAVDLIPYPLDPRWPIEDWWPIADAMIKASHLLDIPIRWGGNWKVNDVRRWHGTAELLNKKYTGRHNDSPHFELTRRYYP